MIIANILIQIKDTGAKVETSFGPIDELNVYKDFDFSVLVNFALGGHVYDSSYASLMAGYKNIRQQSPDLANRWQQPGDVTDVPILLENNNDFNALSTRFLFENDYLRVKGLTLGYTINNSPALSSVGIDNVRVWY